MNTYANSTQENKSQSIATAVSQKKSKSQSTFKIVDNRPEAIEQRKLQDMANNSPQAKQAAQLQSISQQNSLQEPPIQKKANDTGLPDNLKSGVENLSGYSMDDVRVHYNSDNPAQLQAHAYAQGTDIHIAPGQEKHLPHEAWHVVQQKQGRVKPTLQMKDKVNVNDDAGLENEADVMGAKAARLGSNGHQNNELKASSTHPHFVQRKMGVEFESEWKVYDDKTTPIGKKLHKKKVTGTGEFRVENDGGELEFVSDPPSSDGAGLLKTVGKMQNFANTMISNNKKSERLESLVDGAITTKLDLDKYFESNQGVSKTLADFISEVHTDDFQDGYVATYDTELRRQGWNDEDGPISTSAWDVSYYKDAIADEKFPLNYAPFLAPDEYQQVHSMEFVLGKKPESDFEDKYVSVKDAEKEMRTKPQFSFGVPMEMIPKLFAGFVSGLGKEEEQSQIHYDSRETTTLNAFSKKVGKQLTLSDNYPVADGGADVMKGKTGGFITYLNFYLDKMRTGMADFNNSYTAAQIKSVHLAQTILKFAKVNEVSSNYDLDDAKITEVTADLLLTDEDKAQLNEKLDPKTFSDVISDKQITKIQYEALKAYHEEAIEKTKVDLSYPKYYFALMNRSGFDSMYDALTVEEREAVNLYVEKTLIPQLTALKAHNMLFSLPYFYKTKEHNVIKEYGFSYGPKLIDWWNSIAGTGRQALSAGGAGATIYRDLMSPPPEFVDTGTNQADTDQSLGALGFVDEGKVVMELRNWGDFVPASEWVKHTTDMAKALGELLTED